jgi:hypothetical protein
VITPEFILGEMTSDGSDLDKRKQEYSKGARANGNLSGEDLRKLPIFVVH